MLAKVKSSGLQGINGFEVCVEADCSGGLPIFEVVGLGDTAVKESRERVRSAITNSGFEYPAARIIINLAPADIKKEGPIYDLPIAVAIMAASGQMDISAYGDVLFLGELSLNGDVRGINGILPMLIDASARGVKRAVIPKANEKEAAYVNGMDVIAVSALSELHQAMSGTIRIGRVKHRSFVQAEQIDTPFDFKYIRGQDAPRRAVEIAVAGGHNILLIGPPGSGKTMLARAIPSIMPALTFEEALEVTKIHSVSGDLKDEGVVSVRPFRSPHHSASTAALTGGGAKSIPGEVSLAHNGVLFLDELPEFKRDALEALRQPLEDGCVSVARVNAKLNYPSRFMLVASMNPCPCGYYGDPSDKCRCTPGQIRRYLSRVSGPLLNRIDLHIEVPRLQYEELNASAAGESSAEILARIERARQVQIERYKRRGIYTNSQLSGDMFDEYCRLDNESKAMLKLAFNEMSMSARAFRRITMVARTIADLAGEENISAAHIAEAIQYRLLDRKYWGGES